MIIILFSTPCREGFCEKIEKNSYRKLRGGDVRHDGDARDDDGGDAGYSGNGAARSGNDAILGKQYQTQRRIE